MTSASRGLDGVVAVQTRLSHVDGENGILIIGGYELGALAGRVTFEEAAHLLWTGHLPSPSESLALSAEMAGLRPIPDAATAIVREAAARHAPPIDALRMACSTLSLDLPNANDISHDLDVANAKMLVARFPTIAAAYMRASAGQEPIAPRTDLSLAANFLYMMNGKEPEPLAARALDTYWVTVIDHGMNASTFTARVIASTRSDMVSAVTGAIGALKGPLHGGAPGPVLDMLDEIRASGDIDGWLEKKLAAGGRLMGFGHRVFRIRDPRADVLRAAVAALNKHAGRLAFASEVETKVLVALARHKPGRSLQSNIEMNAALLLDAVGVPRDAFTQVFAIARSAGWLANALEQQKTGRMIRPASNYVGPRPAE
jgi:citrate synthase